jgi:nucleotide-binding universal stress UspA family protein
LAHGLLLWDTRAMAVIHKVLCPVDFSKTSGHAFIYAAAVAQQFDAELTVLHVMEAVPLATAYAGVPDVETVRVAEKYAEKELARLVASVDAGKPRVRSAISHGETHNAILNYAAQNDVDLIVIGKHGRKKLEFWLFGSVTERVIRRAACPVMVVQNPEGVKLPKKPKRRSS